MNLRKLVVPFFFVVTGTLSIMLFALTKQIPQFIFEMETLGVVAAVYAIKR